MGKDRGMGEERGRVEEGENEGTRRRKKSGKERKERETKGKRVKDREGAELCGEARCCST